MFHVKDDVFLAFLTVLICVVWFEVGIRSFFWLTVYMLGYLTLLFCSLILYIILLSRYTVWKHRKHRGERVVLEIQNSSWSDLYPCCQEANDWLESHSFRRIPFANCYPIGFHQIFDVCNGLRDDVHCEIKIVK